MVFGVGDVAGPVPGILDLPVPADEGFELGWSRLVGQLIGDRVDGLGAPLALVAQSLGATGELDGLGSVRKRNLGGAGQDLGGADLPVSVATFGGPLGGFGGFPRQGDKLAAPADWLPFAISTQCALREATSSTCARGVCTAFRRDDHAGAAPGRRA